ncbi:MAG: hypothetical protein LBS60_06630 [Deltaproteobacteria bacterium]|jgi:hypothetical protein|nr:hypothetical protein [Deltaproteobacteria bacterium]
MKVRQGFVTNSSSTSFVISLKGDFTRDNFFKALGLKKDFPLANVITSLFKTIQSRAEDFEEIIPKGKSFEDLTPEWLAETDHCGLEEELDTIKKLLAEKRKVYFGEFWDDNGDAAEAFLRFSYCSVSTDDLYFETLND